MSSEPETSLLPLFVLHEHADAVLCCNFFPSEVYQREESNWLLSGDAGGLVVLWNLATRRPVVSFSAQSEARQQLRHRLEQGALDEAAAKAAGSVFGQHSHSVLAVGFVPASLPPPGPAVGESPSSQAANSSVRNGTVAPTSAVARELHPGRPRFRLVRKAAPGVGSAASKSTKPAEQAAEQAFESFICFYTHCRDQRVYIWTLRRDRSEATAVLVPQLLAVLTAPQHGFCPAESVSTRVGSLAQTHLAVPHDTGGEITVWELTWQASTHASRDQGCVSGEAASSNAPATHVAAEQETAAGEDAEEVDTTGMNPMDALIARAAAAERRQQRAPRASASTSDSFEGTTVGAASPSAVLATRECGSVLCYVAAADDAAPSCGFRIRRSRTFSACPTFKGGTIMRLTMCDDAQHLAVAFESGHVVLARYRDAEQPPNAPPAPAEAVRSVTRAFAESALVCWWSGRRMLACSAEGGLHCYEVTEAARGPLEVQLTWSVTLRKGVGSVFLQGHLVVAGCWDSTLRLYDARDGRLVSIVSYQGGTVNEVRMAPPTIARAAAFGFDVRQPRCYASSPAVVASTAASAGAPDAVHGGSAGEGETAAVDSAVSATTARTAKPPTEQLVYLFASASKDSTVAVWRVDLGLVVQRLARQAITA